MQPTASAPHVRPLVLRYVTGNSAPPGHRRRPVKPREFQLGGYSIRHLWLQNPSICWVSSIPPNPYPQSYPQQSPRRGGEGGASAGHGSRTGRASKGGQDHGCAPSAPACPARAARGWFRHPWAFGPTRPRQGGPRTARGGSSPRLRGHTLTEEREVGTGNGKWREMAGTISRFPVHPARLRGTPNLSWVHDKVAEGFIPRACGEHPSANFSELLANFSRTVHPAPLRGNTESRTSPNFSRTVHLRPPKSRRCGSQSKHFHPMASHPDASQPRQDGSGHPWASTPSPARQGGPRTARAPDNERLATRWSS